jgi:biotin carboxylase
VSDSPRNQSQEMVFMSPNRRILIIGGGREQVETLEKARSLGLEVLYIQRTRKLKEAALQWVDHVVLSDFQDTDTLIATARMLQAIFPFSCAVSLSEDWVVPTAAVCEALGLPGNSLETSTLLKDKSLMRRRLDEHGFSPVAARVGHTQADVSAFVRDHGLPIIIKPTDESGSLGVFRIGEPAQIEDTWRQMHELALPRFLMEEYLDGPEISVESFSFHGRHVVLAITDKLTLPNYVEIGHSMPARLDDALRAEVTGFVTEFLDLVKLKEGPAHTEIKLTSKGLRIVESHNRVGGDRINEMVRVAYGVDMKALTFGWASGLMPALESAPRLQAGVAIRFLTPPPGVVQEIRGLDEVRRAEGLVELQVEVGEGDRVHPVKMSHDRAGHVIASGASVEEAIRRCEDMARMVHIATA